jgi:acetolactate synthase-1/2/3 large subunit
MIPDFVKLAESYGITGKRVSKSTDLQSTLEEAINSDEPYLIDCIIEAEENVFPMVPPGGSLDKMVLKEDVE